MRITEYFYFGQVPEEFREDFLKDVPKDWLDNSYFRIRVEYGEEEIKIEDSCGRMVPFCFEDIKELRKILKAVKKEVSYG